MGYFVIAFGRVLCYYLQTMNKLLYNMLKSSAEADIDKAKLSLHLLGNKSVGIGDHSTGDFYKNAEEALALLDNAQSRLETLDKLIKEEI